MEKNSSAYLFCDTPKHMQQLAFQVLYNHSHFMDKSPIKWKQA